MNEFRGLKIFELFKKRKRVLSHNINQEIKMGLKPVQKID